MENVFTAKGKLAVSIGEGYLSAYEISVLKPGDIVKTTKLAGEGYSIFFNGHFLFTGEVVVISKSFGIRVTSFYPPKVGAEIPANSDDVIEMLPIMVRLGEIEVSLSELKGVGPGTIINLDTPYSSSCGMQTILPTGGKKLSTTNVNRLEMCSFFCPVRLPI